ncbi:MAG: hypothetical protein EOM26_00695 [Alphaproteobacteria bacterium]|nr:hypothetical protein [Alphaproteobacteria bacterium]
MTYPIPVNSIYPDLKAANKKQVLRFLSRKAAANLSICQDMIFSLMTKFERELPSGIGDGVAIPHLRLPGVPAPFSIFARLPEPVDFDAVDNQPVDLVYFLLSPEEDGPYHLRRLSRATRLFRDASVCRRLRAAKNDNTIRDVISSPDILHHAA